MSNSIEYFGKYVLLEKLATGGMAEVYLAKSMGANGVNKFLAIKRILPQFSENEEFIDMFKEEAKIAVNLNHGNVVSIYDFGVEKNQFYLVMEYVEGRNLRQMINELKKKSVYLSTEQVVYTIKEVAAGLDHAHRCIDGSTGKPLNITHRDMSPQNIMVSFEGEVKIIDFGIAKAETQLEATKAGTLKGKFGYMSPEQAEGYPIDLRTDVFSLGIVLWELLANDRLFTSNSEAAILRKIRDCQIPSIRKLNPSVHPELERIVGKALTKDKTLRYQTSAALHRDLNRFLNTQYPEFSPHDFSVFIKNAFTEVYTEQKKKLVEFAKITKQVPDDSVVTVTMMNRENTVLQSKDPEPEIGQEGNEEVSNPGFSEPQGSAPISSAEAKTVIRPYSPSQDQVGMPSSYPAGSVSNSAQTPAFTQTRAKKSKVRQEQSNTSAVVAFALTAAVVVGLGYFLFGKKNEGIISQNQGTSSFSSQNPPVAERPKEIETPNQPERVITNRPVETTPAVVPTPPPPRVVEAPQPPVYAPPPAPENAVLTVYSDPDDATLSINGIDTGFRTPYRLSHLMNQDFQIKISKSGYFPLEKVIRLTKPTNTLRYKLVKEAYGYINLYVVNAGSNPSVEVNGVIVSKKLPLVTHKIPAGIPVRIRVSNEFLGTSATETVTVTEDQKKFVELVLKSSP